MQGIGRGFTDSWSLQGWGWSLHGAGVFARGRVEVYRGLGGRLQGMVLGFSRGWWEIVGDGERFESVSDGLCRSGVCLQLLGGVCAWCGAIMGAFAGRGRYYSGWEGVCRVWAVLLGVGGSLQGVGGITRGGREFAWFGGNWCGRGWDVNVVGRRL